MRRFVLAAAFTLAVTPSLALELTSSDVTDGAVFNPAFVCTRHMGSNVSPALSWSGVPANAKSLAITMFDPDAGGGTGFWHWLAVDIPASNTGLARGAASEGGTMPAGAKQLPNGRGDGHYAGPCPPNGTGAHHYQITLYAMGDAKVAIDPAMKPQAVGDWLKAHALATARITPVFGK